MLKGISMNRSSICRTRTKRTPLEDKGTGQGSDPAVVQAQEAAEEEQDHEDDVQQRFQEADPGLIDGIGGNAFQKAGSIAPWNSGGTTPPWVLRWERLRYLSQKPVPVASRYRTRRSECRGLHGPILSCSPSERQGAAGGKKRRPDFHRDASRAAPLCDDLPGC